MKDKFIHKIYLGFLSFHILHHANEEPIYGSWMLEELRSHGYKIGPSHVYPLLTHMTKHGLLTMKERLENKKIRKYYTITKEGIVLLEDMQHRLKELFKEVVR